MEHKQITTQGGTVHYWIDRKDTSCDCIVFSHGVTADHTIFEKQIEFFSNKYTIILWDIPMHGLSKSYHNFSYLDTADILHTILVKENIEKVVLIGMSMGGYPSQHFAALYPKMVKGFVALDTTPLGLQYYSKSDLWWLKKVSSMAKLFPAKILKMSMARSVSKSKYSYQKMMSILKPLSKKEIIEQMKIAYEYFPVENKNITFSFPTLILVGENDDTGKVKKYCEEWAKQTGFSLHYIKKAKHFANGDNPDQVNNEIDIFINNLNFKEVNSNVIF